MRNPGHAAFFEALPRAQADVIGQVEQNIVASTAVNWRAAGWWLARRVPAEYADPKDEAEREAMKKQMAEELLGFMRHLVSGGAYRELLVALSKWGDLEIDAKALPCPV